jgi:hypothetical protein
MGIGNMGIEDMGIEGIGVIGTMHIAIIAAGITAMAAMTTIAVILTVTATATGMVAGAPMGTMDTLVLGSVSASRF